MKKIIILFIVMLLSSISVFSANEEYTFILEFDHNFDDNEDIECEVIFDDRDKTLDFDEDTQSDDFIYENEFEKTLEVVCDDRFDEIEVEIKDEEGVRIDKFDYDSTKGFEYELDLVDEDDEWFTIIVDHDFNENEEIECELEIDSNKYDYEFDKESDNYELSRNYRNEVEFECDDELDEILLIVYNENEQEEFRDTFNNDDKISFDEEDLELSYEFKLEFNHDFKSDEDEISCDVELDGDSNKEVSFDEDSGSSDTRYIDDFKEKIEIDCNEDVDEIVLIIYNEDGDKIDSEVFEDDNKFEYDLTTGAYNFFLIIEDVIGSNEEVKCELFLDKISFERFTLDSTSSLIDKRKTNSFNEKLELLCDQKLTKIELLVYEDEDSNQNLFEKIYVNQQEIIYTINQEEVIELEETPVVIEVVPVEVEEEKIVEDPIKEDSLPLETNEINVSANQNTQNTIDSEVIETTGNKEEIIPNMENSQEVSEKDSFSGFLIIILILAIIGVIIMLGYKDKKFTTFKQSTKKQRTTKKKDIDFTFLNKKK